MTAYAPLRDLLAGAGYAFIEPPILFEARIFVELAGEDLRRRLFLANAADGTEMALRPDYTIPVCLHHLANGTAKRRAGYAYLGPIFRQRPGESGEFLQAGVESLGRGDRAAADADMLELALEAVALLGGGRQACGSAIPPSSPRCLPRSILASRGSADWRAPSATRRG